MKIDCHAQSFPRDCRTHKRANGIAVVTFAVWSIRLRKRRLDRAWSLSSNHPAGCKAGASWDRGGVEKVADPLPNDEANAPFNSMTVFDCLLWRFAPDNPTGVRWETIGAILKNSLISALDC